MKSIIIMLILTSFGLSFYGFQNVNKIVKEDIEISKAQETEIGDYIEGYNVVGKIEIPKTNLESPILNSVTKKSIEMAVAILYGPGLNEVGNTVIIGHNYNNGQFFSDNDKLEIGDSIFITSENEKIEYEIYDIFETSPEDTEYMLKDTNGYREISLSTTNDESTQRLIILAREKE